MTATQSVGRLELIAHRGASAYAPENTLAAFKKAVELGAASIEFDVQQTKDGRLAVVHDADFKRTAGASRKVGAMTYDEVFRLDVGSWFGPAFAGERVPLLEGVLDLVEGLAPGEVELHLELKHGLRAYDGIEARVLRVLRERPAWEGRAVVSSFNHRSLAKVRSLDPEIRLGYLVGLARRAAALREARTLGCESVHLSVRQADRRWAEAVHAAGMRALVYTVNTPELLARVRGMGFDGAFTNFPDLMEEARVKAAP